MGGKRVKLVLFIVGFLSSTLVAFNLEPRVAIVKRGPPGSYFGYSVAQHQVVDRNSLNSLGLVGAPKGDSGQPGTNRTGGVWHCPLTQAIDDCKQIENIIPGSNLPPSRHEIRDDQWLGVAVSSQGPGGKVIVCAHRYTRRGEDYRWGQGQCFTLTNKLNFDETWEPCRGRDTSRAHEQWGFCQAGTSAVLLPDKTALIGTPGTYTWRGTVFAVSTSDDFLFRDKTHYYSPVLGKDSPVEKYSYLGMAVAAGNFLPTGRNCGEYLSYAVGAPRANGTGQVVLFVKCHSELLKVQMVLAGDKFASSFGYTLASADVDSDGLSDLFVGAPFHPAGGAVYYYKNTEQGLKTNPTLLTTGGTRTEARFGFALSSAGDVNNDGYEDLAVGAPYDGNGAVYLYQGSSQGLRSKPSQIIRAEDIPVRLLQTFGYSLSGGLDMDLNNHTDLLVGAYQSDSVVILRARPVIDISTWFGNKTVRINPRKLGCDMDPTSEEVCFEVESCFQIRNFPINIETTIVKYKIMAEVFDGGKKISRVRFSSNNGEMGLHSNEKIVQVRKNNLDGCFKELVYLKEGTADIRSPIKFLIEYSLGLDEPTVQGGRIPNINQFPILNRNEASKELEIPFHKDCGPDEVCQSSLTAQVKLYTDDGTELTGNILELGENREILVNITIDNSAGDPAYFAWMNLNYSRIFSFVGRSDDVTDILCDLVGDVSIRCNLGNPFLQRTETIQFKFVPIYTNQMPPDVMFTTSLSTTSENISPLDLISSTQFQVVQRAEVSIRGSVRPETIFYGGHVVGESAIRDIAEIGSRVLHTFHIVNDGPWQADGVNVHIDWPYQVESGLNQGKWLLYLTDEVEVSPPGVGRCFLNPRHVNFLGLRKGSEKSRHGNRTFHSSQYKHKSVRMGGAPLNSIVRDTVREVEDELYSGSSFYKKSSVSRTYKVRQNTFSSKTEQSYTRAKREVDQLVEPDRILREDGTVSRVVVFDCGRKSAKCLTISCNFPRLARRDFAVIRLRSRVWNSTLVEDYPHIDSVVISARARLELSPNLESQQLRSDDETTVSVEAFPDGLAVDGGMANIPIWVMVVSIMAGLFVVIIITLILWKFGFFERKRVSDVTQSVKISKQYPLLGGNEYIS